MKREVAGNTFQDGLQMDMNDFSKSNSTLASCLNGTLVTFNGNEYVLQNDLGNGRVETAYLPENYVPLGTASYGGIIYIVSYNPKDNKCQIGSFPSPERNISSDEIGSENYRLSKDDFIHNDVVDTFVVEKKLGDTLYSPGDFFLVTGTNLANNVDQIFDPNGNNNSVNTTLKLSLGSTSEDGKVTILTNVKTYTISNEKGTITKKLILAPQNNTEEGQSPTVEEYRSVISQPYNVFSSKERGKLVLIAELLCCDSFTISVKNNADFINGYTPTISYTLEGNNYVFTGCKWSLKYDGQTSIAPQSGTEDLEGQEIKFTSDNSPINGSFDIQSEIKALNTGIVTIEVTPVMNWGEATFLKQTKTIDLSKIGTGAIELSQWKYYNDSSKCTIQWALNTYLEETQYIDNVSMTFKRITDFQGEESNRTYTTETLSYVISKKSDYNSTFYENIPLDTEYYKLTNNGETGILVSDKLYLATITITKKDTEDSTFSDRQEFYRWILTNSMFNEQYKTVSNFNDLTLQLKGKINGSLDALSSTTAQPNEQEYQEAPTYQDLDPGDSNIQSPLDSYILTLKQYYNGVYLVYQLNTNLIGGKLFKCNIANYSNYIDTRQISKEYTDNSGPITNIGSAISDSSILNNKIFSDEEMKNYKDKAPDLESTTSYSRDNYGNGIYIEGCNITPNNKTKLGIQFKELYLFKAACNRRSTSAVSNGTFIPLVYDARTLSDYNLIIKNNHIIPYMMGSFAFKEGGGDKGSLYVSKFYNTINQETVTVTTVPSSSSPSISCTGYAPANRTEGNYSKVKKENNLYIGFSDPDFVKGTQIQGWQGASMFVTLEGMRIIDSGQKEAYIRFKSKDQANEDWLYESTKSETKPVFMSDPCTAEHGKAVNKDVLRNTNVVLVAIKDRDTDVYYPINFGTRAVYIKENNINEEAEQNNGIGYVTGNTTAKSDNISSFNPYLSTDGTIKVQLDTIINYQAYFTNSGSGSNSGKGLQPFYNQYANILNNIYRFDNNPVTRLIITPKDISYYKNWKLITTFKFPIINQSITKENLAIQLDNKQLSLNDYIDILKTNTQASSFNIEVALPEYLELEYSNSIDFSTDLRDKLLNQQITINKTAILGFDGNTFIGWSDTPVDETALYCRDIEYVEGNEEYNAIALPKISKATQFKPLYTKNERQTGDIFVEWPDGYGYFLLYENQNVSQNLIPFLAIKDGQLVLKNPTSGLELERITSGDNGIVDGFQQNIGFSNQYRPFKPLLNTE